MFDYRCIFEITAVLFFYWLIEWLISDWLIHMWIDWLIDWLIDWHIFLIDWSIDWFIFIDNILHTQTNILFLKYYLIKNTFGRCTIVMPIKLTFTYLVVYHFRTLWFLQELKLWITDVCMVGRFLIGQQHPNNSPYYTQTTWNKCILD